MALQGDDRRKLIDKIGLLLGFEFDPRDDADTESNESIGNLVMRVVALVDEATDSDAGETRRFANGFPIYQRGDKDPTLASLDHEVVGRVTRKNENMCLESPPDDPGWICTWPKDHAHPQHIASGQGSPERPSSIGRVWPKEPPPDPITVLAS